MNQALKNPRFKKRKIYSILIISTSILLFILLSVLGFYSKGEFRLIYGLLGLIFVSVTIIFLKMDDLTKMIDASNLPKFRDASK